MRSLILLILHRCVNVLHRGESKESMYVLLFVYDVVIATGIMTRMDSSKKYLLERFRMTNLKNLRHLIGKIIEMYEDEVCLGQVAYVKMVINKFNMCDCSLYPSTEQTQL